jgi:hypothetical protein
MSDRVEDRFARILQLAASYAQGERSMRRGVAIDYLIEIGELLSDTVDSQQVVAPLLDLIPFVAETDARLPFEERRNSTAKPSNELMVRVIASIDILEDCGFTLEGAAQHVSRQMMRAGAALPSEGGDPRAWKRLLIWRDRLLHLKGGHPAWASYERFKTEMALLSREAMVAAATNGSLWNLRLGKAALGSAA